MWLRRAALVVGVAAALGACGSGAGPGGGSGSDSPSDAPPNATSASLEIEVRAKPGADAKVASLECGDESSASGFITDAEGACRAVEDSRSLLLNGPPDNVMCTEIYGGPQTATISGTLAGERVRLGVSREDGCAIATWDALEPLVGSP